MTSSDHQNYQINCSAKEEQTNQKEEEITLLFNNFGDINIWNSISVVTPINYRHFPPEFGPSTSDCEQTQKATMNS